MDEIDSEIKQRERAMKSGEMVEKMKPEALRIAQAENEADIEHMSRRRSRDWARLADPTISERERTDLAYAVKSATEILARAFTFKRRLAVIASLA